MNTRDIVGAGPVIWALCEEIGLVVANDQGVPWDSIRCHLSRRERILALIINILTARQPLYRGQRFHFLPDATFVDAWFVQKPDVLLLACLVLSLLARRVRQGLPLPTPSRSRPARPRATESCTTSAPCW